MDNNFVFSENNNQSDDIPIEPKDTNDNSFREELFDWAQNIAIILTVVVLVFIFVIRIIGVEGSSMEPTLHNRDWMIISNLFYEPNYGDIVVLTKKTFMEQPIVKRVIATEGETVDIDFNAGIVKVNGVALKEPYIAEKTHRSFDLAFPVKVPKDSVFVMGDNRNHSSDSRDASLGMVNKKYILGRLLFRIYPFDRMGRVKQDYTLPVK